MYLLVTSGDYLQNLAIVDNLQDRSGMAVAYGQLANLAQIEKRFADAEVLYRYAITLDLVLGESILLVQVIMGLAVLYAKQNKLKDVIKMEAAIRIGHATGFLRLIVGCRIYLS